MKSKFLFFLIAILPISQKINISKNANTALPAIGHFKVTRANCFIETPKTIPAVDTSQLKQSSWYATAMKNMEQGEYHFKKVEKTNNYSTPNRKNNLRFYYDENGFSVEPRTTQIPIGEFNATKRPDEIKYKTIANWKVAFNLDKKQIGKGAWQVNGNKAEYITDNITVQYINNEEGMRQNFIVQKPLPGNKNLKLHFSVKTTLAQRFSSDRLQFANKKSGTVLNYEQLKVWDADGKPLDAAFEKSNNDYCIHVNTQNASYPITIDPLSTAPAAMVESNQADARMGWSVAGAGDVNGDGYSDVIVGARFYDNGEINEGAAFVYHGSATGINTTTAAAMVESNRVGTGMGNSVASAGDVNGDGYSDVIVGAFGYSNGQGFEGAFFVYHGSATGINTTAAAMVESNQANAQMGWSVASAGDVNGDGYSDIIVGAYKYDNGEDNEGAAFVYRGSATGINTNLALGLESDQAGAWMGYSVASAGDVNGDGYSDVIVGAYLYDNGQIDEGAVFVYHGSLGGLYSTAFSMVESNEQAANMGGSVASAGDVNGDGYCDIIVGAFGYNNGQAQEGAAFIYHGSATRINTNAAAILEGNQIAASMGVSVASAGDVNGDGYSDVIVGAYRYDNGENDEGAAFVYHGSATGINTNAAAMVESNQANAQMGWSVASAGDVNGDGYSDVIVGAYLYDKGETDEGAAFVYHGSASSISTTAVTTLESNQADAYMGWSVASAGDVNGDGYSDVIIGAPFYDNGQTDEGAAFVYHGSPTGINTTAFAMVKSNQANAQMGVSVASAGDVNGDGYSDVIVGASYYDNGQIDEGAVFVYHGSATGINTSTASMVESNQASARMGLSIASAGDVNGDGYSDIIVGAYQYDNVQNNEGAAFVYHGSATGINTNAAAIVESNQANAFMGYSVSGAGDVNGDGYSDIIVGAYQYDNVQNNEGAAFVYHGSATGINTNAASMVESNQATALMGYSVAGAGDVNGDGYSDIIVGAFLYDNGQAEEGVAFVYHGSAMGINTNVAAMVESNQAGAYLGYSVAGAGDVNGDGYSDIIAGAYTYDNGQAEEGAAFVYHGSATGISTTAAAMVESNQAIAGMGNSVAGAGDVNGDGYSDIIVGASGYKNSQIGEGAAFVYYGNSPGTGIRNNLHLYNTNLTTPIRSSNFVSANFGAGLFAKSFLGRGKGKLVWETRLNYNPYSGTPITNSMLYTSQQSSYTDLGLTGTELKNLVAKQTGGRYTKIRARIKYQYNAVTAITGQLYGPWRYVSDIVTGLSLGALPVDLISFNAEWLQQGKTAQVKFITDNESQVCCYNIEKSSDGVHYNNIGKVDAKNTGGRTSYSFNDNNATGKKLFYRLQTNFSNGTTEYSNIQMLQNNSTTEIIVFPNPATNVLQLRLNNSYATMNVQIINGAGQVVKQYSNKSTTGQVLQIPISDLASGTYFLYLQSGSEKQVLQFVKE
jgi:hypothetical protein